MLILTDLDNELVLATERFQGLPKTLQLHQILIQAMLLEKRDRRHEPHRPRMIQCDNAQISQDLRPLLTEIGVKIEFNPAVEDIDMLFAEIETMYMTQMAGIPGLLSVAGVTPVFVEDLFAAAARFYRHTPWKFLTDEQPLAVYFPSWEKRGYVQLMGNAGLEFGLVLFWSWDELLSVYHFSKDPLDHLPDSGWRALTFETLDTLPSSDQTALEKYGWEVAGEHAYPFPIVLTLDIAERPDRQELLAYIVLMRAIPRFLDEVLEREDNGDFLPAHRKLMIEAAGELVKVEISYPAGDLSQAERQTWRN